MSLLIDSGAFYALADASDRHSSRAAEYFRANFRQESWMTTSAILIESWTLIRNKLGWHAARRFLQQLRESGIEIIQVEPSDIDTAARILDEYSDQQISLIDASTFAVMERRGVNRAFGFDKDFLLYRYGPSKSRSFSLVP